MKKGKRALLEKWARESAWAQESARRQRRQRKLERSAGASWAEGRLPERPCSGCGRPFTPPPDADARQLRQCGTCLARAGAGKRRPAVRTVSGGLPTLGKRHR